ncbi:MAG TPA: hypothetical protein VMM56_05835, partial [Planctomycetaceae bacterium]|nr:hypothetical protein [Planctomycetaceae bacterium]
YLITASTAVGTLLLLFAIWPSKTSQLLARIVAPFANIGNVQATDMTVTPGDTVVAAGDPLRIELAIADDRVKTANLLRLDDKRSETSLRMKTLSADAEGNPRFYLSVPSVTENFRYRLHSGGAISRYYDVKVVPRPTVEEFEIHYEYPSYLSRVPRTETGKSGKIKGLVGSRVRLVATTNTPIESAQMTIAGMKSHPAELVAGESGSTRCTWEFDLTDELIVARTWTLQLKDKHGFVNWPAEYLIQAVKDAPPSIVIIDPQEKQLRLKRTDTLPIQFRVEDDFGVRQISLLATIDGKPYKAHPIPLSGQSSETSIESSTLIELARLARKTTRQMTFQLQADDYRSEQAADSEAALSEIVTVTLDETAESYFEKQSALEYSSVREILKSVLADLQEAKQKTEGLDQLVQTEGRLETTTVERIDQVRDLTGQAEEALRELGKSLPDTSFVALATEVIDLADTDVKSARAQAGRIKLTDLPEERVEHSKHSDQHVAQAIVRTEKLLADLDQLWELIQKIADLTELAAQQQELADELAETDFKDLPELPFTEEQMDLAEQIAESIQAAPETLQEVLEAFQQEAEDLVAKAQELSEQQEQLAELTETSKQPELDPEQLREQIAKAIEKQQEAIANETAKLDEQIEDSNKAGEDKSSALSAKPKDVLNHVKDNKFPEAAKDAAKATDNLNKAADALAQNQPVPDLPEDNADPKGHDPQAGTPPKDSPAGTDPADQPASKSGDDPANPDPNATPPKTDSPQGKPEKGKPEPGTPEGEPSAKSEPAKPAEGDPLGEINDPGKSAAKSGEKPEPGEGDNPQAAPPGKADPVPAAQLAAKAADLAMRQAEVAEQLKALAEGKLDKALELMQENVAAETKGLATKTDALALAMKLLNETPQAKEQAAQAAAQVTQAASEATQAEQKLASLAPAPATGDAPEPVEPAEAGTPPQAQPAQVANAPEAQQTKAEAVVNQKQASQALANASQNLQNLAQQIAEQATAMNLPEPAAGSPVAAAAAGDLAEALANAAETLAQLPASAEQPAAAQAAAQSSQATAQALANAAQAAAQAAGVPTQSTPSSALAQASQTQPGLPTGAPSPSSASSSQPGPGFGNKGIKGGSMDNELELRLKDYGISLDQWTRLPGNLKTKIQQAEAADVPEEYRTMVRRYFRELARRNSK